MPKLTEQEAADLIDEFAQVCFDYERCTSNIDRRYYKEEYETMRKRMAEALTEDRPTF